MYPPLSLDRPCVWITRPEGQPHDWTRTLQAAGWDAHDVPTLRLQAFADARTEQVLAKAPYDALMFVSQAAVQHFFTNPAAPRLQAPRYWCTGPGTRQALIQSGIAPDRIDSPQADATLWDSEGLWEQVQAQVKAASPSSPSQSQTAGGLGLRPACSPLCVLIVRGADHLGLPTGRNWLHEQLVQAGAQVETLCTYQRMPISQAVRPGIWVFSSSFSVHTLQGENWRNCDAIATHPRIEQAAREKGFRQVWGCAPTATELLACLDSHYPRA